MGSQVADKPGDCRHALQGKPGSASQALPGLTPKLLLCHGCYFRLASMTAGSGGVLQEHVSAGSKSLHSLKPRQHATRAHR